MEKTFWDAANGGEVEEVKSILRKNPSLNVNWKNEGDHARTALFVMAMTRLSPSSLPIPISIPI